MDDRSGMYLYTLGDETKKIISPGTHCCQCLGRTAVFYRNSCTGIITSHIHHSIGIVWIALYCYISLMCS